MGKKQHITYFSERFFVNENQEKANDRYYREQSEC